MVTDDLQGRGDRQLRTLPRLHRLRRKRGMNPLIPGRGVLNCEYADQLLEKIERTNCLKGCIHGVRKDYGIECELGLLAAVALSEGQPVPEFDLHGNRYITCLMREEPSEPKPVIDLGPDLFSEEAR